MNLNADLVVLSSCESSVRKLYLSAGKSYSVALPKTVWLSGADVLQKCNNIKKENFVSIFFDKMQKIN